MIINKIPENHPFKRGVDVQKDYEAYVKTKEAKTFLKSLFKDKSCMMSLKLNDFPYILDSIDKKYHYVLWFNPIFFTWSDLETKADYEKPFFYKYLKNITKKLKTNLNYGISPANQRSVGAIPHIHIFINEKIDL